MFHAQADEAFEERDGVFGDKLFEGDKEAGFDSHQALDRRRTEDTSLAFILREQNVMMANVQLRRRSDCMP